MVTWAGTVHEKEVPVCAVAMTTISCDHSNGDSCRNELRPTVVLSTRSTGRVLDHVMVREDSRATDAPTAGAVTVTAGARTMLYVALSSVVWLVRLTARMVVGKVP